ncbi:replication/maintenance protein RepL [Bacillus cereus]|uniref:Replication/maintenance protein RepL n=1 Tax=Bacillus cereus TaxID=1396 RepID=A0AAW5L302_BACCE|nr:replication/maintenance protein RepL [Bacillus cereus]MCQ6288637.1 replication/maintenance protein RepL [Bacillus cereus]MCQ6317957.1 replication/maintenance protein RepL [Bacillus cereus]MCQ6329763.1 replication/maintenance protein RepL [Bacillus cereus]MCQ6385751.1 replication/maintenance protein RepL [Bacillus cereus]
MKMKHDRNWNALLDLQLQGEKKIQVLNFVMERLDAKNQLHMTQKEIAEQTPVSERTVSETMKTLQESNFLQRLQSGVYEVNEAFEYEHHLSEEKGLAKEMEVLRDNLQTVTVKNVLNKSMKDVQQLIESDLEDPKGSTLTKEDVKELLDQHVKSLEKTLHQYYEQKEKGVSWKEAIHTLKENVKQSYQTLKETFMQKVKQNVQTVKDAPGQVKQYTKSRFIDGVVRVNNLILTKSQELNQKLEQARPYQKETLQEKEQLIEKEVVQGKTVEEPTMPPPLEKDLLVKQQAEIPTDTIKKNFQEVVTEQFEKHPEATMEALREYIVEHHPHIHRIEQVNAEEFVTRIEKVSHILLVNQQAKMIDQKEELAVIAEEVTDEKQVEKFADLVREKQEEIVIEEEVSVSFEK